MKGLIVQLGLVLLFCFANAQYVFAEEIMTGLDKETNQDKVLLHGTIVNLQDRILFLEDVNPLCRGERSFVIRYFDPNVPLAKGGTVWFWMIGNCDGKTDVIDIVANPRGI